MAYKVLKRARPNGHYVELGQHDEHDPFWVVTTTVDGEEDESEFSDLAEAEEWFSIESKALADLPNWTAQAAYDEAWAR